MKKALLLVAALAIGGTAFAQNKSLGLDIHLGMAYSFTTMDYKFNDPQGTTQEKKDDRNALGVQLKLATYDTPWVNNHIGLYGAIGVDIGAKDTAVKVKDGDTTSDKRTVVSGEFALGPAFAMDFGNNRFQIGVPLHLAVSYLISSNETPVSYGIPSNGIYKAGYGSRKDEATAIIAALGFALTPQFRFAAEKRVSLVVGADLVFDFPVSASEKTKRTDKYANYPEGNIDIETTVNADIKSSFRFGFTPYIGVGINF